MKYNKGDMVKYVMPYGRSMTKMIPTAVGLVREARETLNPDTCNYTVLWLDIDEVAEHKESELLPWDEVEEE